MYIDSFRKNTDLIKKYREDGAYLAWVMALYLQRNDIDELANDSLTDGKDDKKIDFIDMDIGLGKITIAQGYYATKQKEEAPSNKASDLNTAAAWLISGDLDEIPDYLRSIIKDCRQAIDADEINTIELLYVHNLKESANCKKELNTVAKQLSSLFQDKGINVLSKELGQATIDALYLEKTSQILVKDNIDLEGPPFFTEENENWIVYNYTVSGKWLCDLYEKYSEDLFSANYRGFLGIGKRKKINNAIKSSAETEPENFLIYNNGITILTLDVDLHKNTIKGVSIINGAQTTGSLGSIDKKDKLANVRVFCKIVKCKDPKIIPKIVKANNTQNEISSWDKYSNSSDQHTLKDQFKELNKEYTLKRGITEVQTELGIYTVAQPVLAFEGNFIDANRGVNNIFLNNYLYESIFNKNTKARHLLLTYTLAKSIRNNQYNIKSEISKKTELTNIEENELILFRNLRFKNFFIYLVGINLENITGIKIDIKKVSFNQEESMKDIEYLVTCWDDIVKTILKILVTIIGNKDLNDYLLDETELNSLYTKVKAMVAIAKTVTDTTSYEKLSNMIWNG